MFVIFHDNTDRLHGSLERSMRSHIITSPRLTRRPICRLIHFGEIRLQGSKALRDLNEYLKPKQIRSSDRNREGLKLSALVLGKQRSLWFLLKSDHEIRKEPAACFRNSKCPALYFRLLPCMMHRVPLPHLGHAFLLLFTVCVLNFSWECQLFPWHQLSLLGRLRPRIRPLAAFPANYSFAVKCTSRVKARIFPSSFFLPSYHIVLGFGNLDPSGRPGFCVAALFSQRCLPSPIATSVSSTPTM